MGLGAVGVIDDFGVLKKTKKMAPPNLLFSGVFHSPEGIILSAISFKSPVVQLI